MKETAETGWPSVLERFRHQLDEEYRIYRCILENRRGGSRGIIAEDAEVEKTAKEIYIRDMVHPTRHCSRGTLS